MSTFLWAMERFKCMYRNLFSFRTFLSELNLVSNYIKNHTYVYTGAFVQLHCWACISH